MDNGFLVSYAVLWVLVVGLGGLVLVCIRQLGELYLISSGLRGVAGDGLDVGRRGDDLELSLADGTERRLREMLPLGGVVVFASQHCQVCKLLLPRLTQAGLGPEVIVAYDDWPTEVPAEINDSRGVVVARMLESGAARRYKVRVTPFAFGVTADLQVRSRGLVNTPEQVAFHLANAVGLHRRPATATS